MSVPLLRPALVAAVATVLVGLTGLTGVVPAVAKSPPVAEGTTSPTTTSEPTPGLGTGENGDAEVGDPLRVTLSDVRPAVLPRRGTVRVVGRVRNVDEVAWTDINVYPFLGGEPMTSAAELATAADSDPRAFVGNRIVKDGLYDTIESLAPGQSARFSIRIPREDLPAPDDAQGVYWFGVHALGSNPDGRDDVSDGRARTFLPAVARPNQVESVQTAVVVPVRRDSTRAADGSVANEDRWARDLDDGGRLDNLLTLAETARTESLPLTWLLDPAVPDAARRLASGNPAHALGPEPTDEEEGEDDSTSIEPPDWTARLTAALSGVDVLALPYGDLDGEAATRHDQELAGDARNESDATLAALGIEAAPAIAPPSGYLTGPTLAGTDPGDQVLVADSLLGSTLLGAPRATVDGRQVIAANTAISRGGPGPGDRRSPLGIRQRLLSEIALQITGETRTPVVVALPATWDPGAAPERFLAGLDQPWLDLIGLDQLAGTPLPAFGADELARLPGETDPDTGLARESFAAVDDLLAAAASFQTALDDNEDLTTEVRRAVLPNLSWARADDPVAARFSTEAATRWLRTRMERITVEAPAYVTLSSTSGRLPVTVVNHLDQPVTVRLSAHSDSTVTVEETEPIALGPGARSSVLVNASSEQIGVHTVEFRVTDPDGQPLGAISQVRIRAAQVSQIIWYVIGAGAALLFGAIVLRVVRRIRRLQRGNASDVLVPDPGTDAP